MNAKEAWERSRMLAVDRTTERVNALIASIDNDIACAVKKGKSETRVKFDEQMYKMFELHPFLRRPSSETSRVIAEVESHYIDLGYEIWMEDVGFKTYFVITWNGRRQPFVNKILRFLRGY